MIDPDFLEDLQRAPEPILAEYELSDDERSTVLSALGRLGPRHSLAIYISAGAFD